MSTLIPEQQRRFARQVVGTLREAGFEAYWAGGCVRDDLLGRTPKDYDVATDATPPQIRKLFGRRRTLAIGAAFGVITVLGPKTAGMVEVTTFRQDAAYSDGRHPDHVTFSSAREDAARRDFTINGLFYDPVEDEVLDYVGGREDLAAGIVRAIGRADQRFSEDKLRMLRAVRFAATFDFRLDDETRQAIVRMAPEIDVVSPERIAMEMRRMLVEPGRTRAVRLTIETGLAAVVLPEIVHDSQKKRDQLDRGIEVLGQLTEPGFPLALAALLHELVDPAAAADVCAWWKLSNKETERVCWLVEHRSALIDARAMRWSALQPLLIAPGINDLLALHEAGCVAEADDSTHCWKLLEQPAEVLNPPPLLTGDDLLAHGVPAGPKYRMLLQEVRRAQLDEEIAGKEDALALVDRLIQQ